jgi:4,4'-diaponeurosporenoate glycosyltransferase
MFLDSDVEIEKDGLKKIADTFLNASKNTEVVMSIAPFHKVKKLYEDLSAIFNIIMLGSMNAFTPFKKAEPTGLFGQSLILKKSTYFLINGHEAVKDKILENVFMAELFQKAGVKLKCFGGNGTLSFRMYPVGLMDLINGWTKAFASGAGRTALPILLNIIFWISAGFMIPIALIQSLIIKEYIILWIAFYLVYALQILWLMKRIGTFNSISAFLFPINLIFYCIVFFRSLYFQISKRKVQWKSREI